MLAQILSDTHLYPAIKNHLSDEKQSGRRTDFVNHQERLSLAGRFHILLDVRAQVCEWVSSVKDVQNDIRFIQNSLHVLILAVHKDRYILLVLKGRAFPLAFR